ncbi:SDR family oxidoreductase [Pedobacter sp.]|uniref:SDR family oxidoreductase n=1 Tax=Pedobacter sp. TaxID=1411316 RepID=UPI003C52F2E2
MLAKPIRGEIPIFNRLPLRLIKLLSIMKIVVIGGSGLIGSKLVTKLGLAGHEVVAASPASGVNTLTGEGLEVALQGASVVVDVANSPSFEDKAVMDFFVTSGTNLLAAEKAAGVGHHVALSVVGTERLQDSGYFRAKLAQEKLIKESGIPYSILHSTQFFEFVGGIVQSGTDGDTVRVSPAAIQPIASDDVVSAMAKITLGNPLNKTVEVAGPEKFHLSELVEKYMALKKDSRIVISDPKALYFGVELNDGSLTPSAHPHLGTISYDEWISQPGNLR